MVDVATPLIGSQLVDTSVNLHNDQSNRSSHHGEASLQLSLTIPKDHGCDNDSLSTNTTTDSKQSVSFHHVEIREFTQILGDNPACTEGPPVALSWDCINCTVQDIDDYEKHRGRRRAEQDLRTDKYQRRSLLRLASGNSTEELDAAEKELDVIRRRNAVSTRRFLRVRKLKRAWVATKRKVGHLFEHGQRKREPHLCSKSDHSARNYFENQPNVQQTR